MPGECESVPRTPKGIAVTLLVAVPGMLLTAVAVTVAVAPRRLIQVMRSTRQSPPALYVALVWRFLVAAQLLFAASRIWSDSWESSSCEGVVFCGWSV